MNDLIPRLCDILSRVNPKIDTSRVTEDTRLADDLGLDSLSMMLLAVETEDKFGFRFEDMPGFATVGALCAYILPRATK